MSTAARSADRITVSGPALVLSWDAVNPLPVRAVRAPARGRGRAPAPPPPDGLPTGPHGRPFDFCGHLRRLCGAVARRCEEFKHLDVSRLLFGMTQARGARLHGLQARVTPLRFEGGALRRPRRGVPYQVQRYLVDGREMLYLVTFCLPRFLDQSFDDKLVTLFHELYHVGAAFDGDLRRHAGRCALHTRSKRRYDDHMAELARGYLDGGADPSLHAFLRLNFSQLVQRHGAVEAVVVPRPKLIPVVVFRNGTPGAGAASGCP